MHQVIQQDLLANLCDRIISGCSMVAYGNVCYYIYDPGPKERLLGQHHYDEMYNAYLNNGVPTKEEWDTYLSEREIWLPQHELELETLQDQLSSVETEINNCEFKNEGKE